MLKPNQNDNQVKKDNFSNKKLEDSIINKKKNNKTLTIILVICGIFIALIVVGCFGSVVFTALYSARNKASIVNMHKITNGIVPSLIMCRDKDETILAPSEKDLCTNEDKVYGENDFTWPILPTGYSYGDVANPDNSNWSFSVLDKNKKEVYRCGRNGCEEIK
jgi:hypothetical protein